MASEQGLAMMKKVACATVVASTMVFALFALPAGSYSATAGATTTINYTIGVASFPSGMQTVSITGGRVNGSDVTTISPGEQQTDGDCISGISAWLVNTADGKEWVVELSGCTSELTNGSATDVVGHIRENTVPGGDSLLG